MASDYKKISEEHEKRYGWDAKPRRIYKRLYSDKTHFVYELIQNADDSESANLEMQLSENELLVWNDGRQSWLPEKELRQSWKNTKVIFRYFGCFAMRHALGLHPGYSRGYICRTS